MVLKFLGYNCCTAYRAADGLALAVTFAPDIMVIDIGMLMMDGNCLAANAREAGTEAILIAPSGFADIDSRQRSAAAGFDHFLAKPADLDKLQDLLAGTVEGTHAAYAH